MIIVYMLIIKNCATHSYRKDLNPNFLHTQNFKIHPILQNIQDKMVEVCLKINRWNEK